MASTKIAMVEITIFDDETGEVEQKCVKTYQCSYGYEVRNFFERFGERFAKIIDPYDEDYFDPYDEGGDEKRDIMCGICDEEELHWEDRGKGFRLYDEDGKLHVCHKPSADDFEDIS